MLILASFLFRKSHHTIVLGFPECSIWAYLWFRKSHHTIVIGLPECSFLASFGRRKSHRSIVMYPPRGGHFWRPRPKRDRVHATKTQRLRVAFLESPVSLSNSISFSFVPGPPLRSFAPRSDGLKNPRIPLRIPMLSCPQKRCFSDANPEIALVLRSCKSV